MPHRLNPTLPFELAVPAAAPRGRAPAGVARPGSAAERARLYQDELVPVEWEDPWSREYHQVVQVAPTGPITADWVHNVLFWRLTVHEWKLLDEVAAREEIAGPRGRRIDVLAVRAPSRPEHGLFERLALEIKCSRGDFLSDVRDPGKQAPWRALTHAHAYVAPAGLIAPHEVPDGSGLMEVHTMRFQRAGWQTPVLRWAVHPPANQPGPVPDWLVMELIYRASYLDVHTKRQLDPGRHPLD